MLRLGLMVALIVVWASVAAAEEQKPLPPQQTFFTLKPTSTPQSQARDQSVALQLKLRRQDFVERDRDSFERNEPATFVAPAGLARGSKANKTKVLIGVVVRF